MKKNVTHLGYDYANGNLFGIVSFFLLLDAISKVGLSLKSVLPRIMDPIWPPLISQSTLCGSTTNELICPTPIQPPNKWRTQSRFRLFTFLFNTTKLQCNWNIFHREIRFIIILLNVDESWRNREGIRSSMYFERIMKISIGSEFKSDSNERERNKRNNHYASHRIISFHSRIQMNHIKWKI